MCEVLKKYIKVLQGESRIEEFGNDEQRVIRKLLASKRLNDFIGKDDDTAETQDEVALRLKNDASVIIEMLQIVLSDETFKASLGICTDMLPIMMEKISPEGMLLISSDNASFQDYARANGVVEDTDEVGLTMLLSRKLYPEHCGAVEHVQRLIDDMECKLAEKMKTLFLIGCLCTGYKNRLMWSHYADSHKGFCIEYYFNSFEAPNFIFPVIYKDTKRIDIDSLDESEMYLSILTKYSDWSRKINHLTSNIFFNILFDFYKRGFIEDFLIYYTIPIKNSKDPIIHPLNSPKNQPNFNEESHPSKNENIKFKNIYRNINVLITKNGYKKIDDILESTKKDNHILYDSRTGIYDDSTEKFKDKTNFKSESIIGKVNKYLNSDI